MVRRVHIRGKEEPYVEPLFGTCTPTVHWLQDLSGGNRGRSRGLRAIEATSHQSTQLRIKESTVSRRPSDENKILTSKGGRQRQGDVWAQPFPIICPLWSYDEGHRANDGDNS